ncbi:MAG TPA: hypothetical protein DDW27_08265 [Bacteroidales bacterium]|nr:hypothetical protein [Bacteroidales bacterium]
MISIIICTVNLKSIKEIEKNVSNTIGVEFELIIIDNSRSQYDIFQAYNIGAKRSQYSILCFMHDDLVYHSNNWGHEVIKHFNSSNTGMIGVGGTRFLSNIPTIWWAGGHKYFHSESGTVCHNCIDTNKNEPSNSKLNFINPENSERSRVVILDGLWFCIRKSLFEEIEFDEGNYKGFHFYDLDICMQVNILKYDIFCIFNIRLEHISSSTLNEEWIKNCNIFYKKWKSRLPMTYVNLPFKQLISIEIKALILLRNIYAINKTPFSYLTFYRNISMLNLLSFNLKRLLYIN